MVGNISSNLSTSTTLFTPSIFSLLLRTTVILHEKGCNIGINSCVIPPPPSIVTLALKRLRPIGLPQQLAWSLMYDDRPRKPDNAIAKAISATGLA